MRSYLLIFLFCFSSVVYSSGKKPFVQYDTSKINTTIKVSPQKEKEIFADKDFVYQKEAKASNGWWEAFLEWLSKLLGKPISKHPKTSYNILKYSLIALFIIGLIFVLWKSKFRSLLTGSSKKIAATAFTDLPDNIEGINIDGLIEEAMGNGNYRLAIRWCFLKALQWLNTENKITWHPAKTNIDYQLELKDKNLISEFISLNRVFEYVWYGEMNACEKLCHEYKTKVEKFISNKNA